MIKKNVTTNEGKIVALLKSEGFNDSPLVPSNIVIYKNIMKEVFMSLQSSKKVKAIQNLSSSFSVIFNQLKQNNKQITISYITKKTVIVHGFIHNMARRQIELGNFSMELEQVLKQTKEQIKAINASENKRSNTISKIYSYIRQISASKEKISQKNKGKLKLEKQDQKGAYKQIINKILNPFTSYLLKLISNFRDYSKILNGKSGEKGNEYLWKMANWSHIIDDIVKELMRMGHYFREDVIGVQVMMSYVLTLDLSVFYDASESQIQKESIKLNEYKKQLQQGKQATQQKGDLGEQLQELKLIIKESNGIKQILNNIFCNEQLILWRKYFSKSQYYNYEQSHRNESTQKQMLLENIRTISKKERKKSQKMQLTLDPQSTYQGLLAKKESSKPQMVDESLFGLQQQEIEGQFGKIVSLKKARMMNFNRFKQKQESMRRKSRLQS